MTRYSNVRRTAWMVLILAMLVPASASAAAGSSCPVCFGEVDHPVMDGLRASILFMVGVTYTLIVSGVVTVILLRRRARRLQLAQQTSSTV